MATWINHPPDLHDTVLSKCLWLFHLSENLAEKLLSQHVKARCHGPSGVISSWPLPAETVPRSRTRSHVTGRKSKRDPWFWCHWIMTPAGSLSLQERSLVISRADWFYYIDLSTLFQYLFRELHFIPCLASLLLSPEAQLIIFWLY